MRGWARNLPLTCGVYYRKHSNVSSRLWFWPMYHLFAKLAGTKAESPVTRTFLTSPAKVTGEALVEAVSRRADRRVTVLCGHTHSPGEYRPLPNLRVLTGAAQYGKPSIQWPLLNA